jgi:hypothetical protein
MRSDEEIRKAGSLEPQVGLRSIGPFFGERLPACAMDIHPGKRPSYGVKTRSKDYDVKFVLFVTGLEALGRKAVNWGLFEIDEFDVVAVELLVIPALKGNALGAERMVLGRQQFRGDRGRASWAGYFVRSWAHSELDVDQSEKEIACSLLFAFSDFERCWIG